MIRIRAGILLVILMLLASCLPARRTVTLALLGDLMVGRAVNPDPASLSYLSPGLKAADLTLANLESPLAPGAGMVVPTNGDYNLCAPSAEADLFPIWHLDMLSLANNHRFDCGPDGVADTLMALTTRGITPVGPGPQPVYRQIDGLKLAFLAFDDILAPIAAPAAMQAIQSARASGAVVVVYVHWGMEYQSGATDRQKTLARQFADAGATLVVGSHPHVLQPAGWITTAQGKPLVLFSRGNALFDQAGLPDTRQSALVLVTLDSQGVRSVQVTPFEIDPAGSRILPPDPQVAAQIRLKLALP